jgi:glyoxylase-like metal-dependent hydrolase (beta-lactamase superfamily II)
VEADNKKILVDTGMAETKEADWHHPGSHQPVGSRIDQRLDQLGVKPEEIDAVIFTHLHWDHCANMKLFKNAEYWVHEDELAFALDPHILYYKSYSSEKIHAVPPFKDSVFRTVAGECPFSPSITMFPTPGHCPGHQSVEVRTGSGCFVIAGDAVFADENLLPDKKRGLSFSPMGRFVNVFQMYDSMEKIIRRADVVLTSHGTGVYKQSLWL